MRIEFKRRDLKEYKAVMFDRPLSIRAVVTDTFTGGDLTRVSISTDGKLKTLIKMKSRGEYLFRSKATGIAGYNYAAFNLDGHPYVNDVSAQEYSVNISIHNDYSGTLKTYVRLDVSPTLLHKLPRDTVFIVEMDMHGDECMTYVIEDS